MALDHVDHLEDMAIGLRGKIAEEDQIALERSGPNIRPEFWSAASQQSGEGRKMLALGDDLWR